MKSLKIATLIFIQALAQPVTSAKAAQKKGDCIGMSSVEGGPLGGATIINVNGSFVQGKKSTVGMSGLDYSDYQTLYSSTQYIPGWMKLTQVLYCTEPKLKTLKSLQLGLLDITTGKTTTSAPLILGVYGSNATGDCATWNLGPTQKVAKMDVFWDSTSIKQVVMTTFDGVSQAFGGTGPYSRDTITFDKNQSLIGLWGFLSTDNTNMIGLGGLIDKCETQAQSAPKPKPKPKPAAPVKPDTTTTTPAQPAAPGTTTTTTTTTVVTTSSSQVPKVTTSTSTTAPATTPTTPVVTTPETTVPAVTTPATTGPALTAPVTPAITAPNAPAVPAVTKPEITVPYSITPTVAPEIPKPDTKPVPAKTNSTSTVMPEIPKPDTKPAPPKIDVTTPTSPVTSPPKTQVKPSSVTIKQKTTETIGRQYVDFYYQTYDTSRDNLNELFTDASTLSYDGLLFEGVTAIIAKLNSTPKTVHKILTFDAQSTSNNDILCFVTGDLIFDGKASDPWIFAETFILRNGGAAGYFFYNDILRIN